MAGNTVFSLFPALNRQAWVAGVLLFFSSLVWANDIEGTWSGFMLRDGKQGNVAITIRRNASGLTADWQTAAPLMSGPLTISRYGPGKVPGSMTLMATSDPRKYGKDGIVIFRFYLAQEPPKPGLYGVVKADREWGKDEDFTIYLERPPCCQALCIIKAGCAGK